MTLTTLEGIAQDFTEQEEEQADDALEETSEIGTIQTLEDAATELTDSKQDISRDEFMEGSISVDTHSDMVEQRNDAYRDEQAAQAGFGSSFMHILGEGTTDVATWAGTEVEQLVNTVSGGTRDLTEGTQTLAEDTGSGLEAIGQSAWIVLPALAIVSLVAGYIYVEFIA